MKMKKKKKAKEKKSSFNPPANVAAWNVAITQTLFLSSWRITEAKRKKTTTKKKNSYET